MAFLSPNDILIAEKNTGNIIRAVDGVISPLSILHVSVTKKDERGLLGLAVSDTKNDKKNTSSFTTRKPSLMNLGNKVQTPLATKYTGTI